MIRNRIFIFFSIGFVLILFGKISKVDLYHNYFKQIEDVEIRNQTDLAGVHYAELVAESSVSNRVTPTVNALLPRIPELFKVRLLACRIPENLSLFDFTFLFSGSPRAP